MTNKTFFIVVVIAYVAFAVFATYTYLQREITTYQGGLSVCTVTHTTVAIGHQAATTVASGGARSWVRIEQPINATNTVALSLGSTPTIGNGIELTTATSTSPSSSFLAGYSTNMPYQGAISARTSTGSTTVKVTQCK